MKLPCFAVSMAALGLAAVPADAALITQADVSGAEYSGSLCSATSACINNALSGPGTVTLGSSYLTFSATPSPSITVSATGSVFTGNGGPVTDTSGTFQSFNPYRASTYAGLQYYAAVSGPDHGPIPIDLAYTITLTVSGYNVGAAWIALNPSNPLPSGFAPPCPSQYIPLKQLVTTGGSSCSDETIGHVSNQTVSGVLTEMIAPNTMFDIGELVEFVAPTSSSATGYAQVDPVLYIDPSFAAIDPNYLTDYTILLSAGVGNTEVPEPLTLSVFTAGLAGTFVMRRRKAKKA